MKKQGHPDYRDVLFIDSSTGESFVCGSTWQSDETEKHTDGNEYPVCRVPISSLSHPFYSGSDRVVDTEGRVDRFKQKYSAVAQKAAKKAEETKEEKKKVVRKRKTAPKKS